MARGADRGGSEAGELMAEKIEGRLICDDPHAAVEADTAEKRKRVLDWFRDQLPFSGNVVIMGRTHDEDLTSRVVGRCDYANIAVPMTYETPPEAIPVFDLPDYLREVQQSPPREGWQDSFFAPGEWSVKTERKKMRRERRHRSVYHIVMGHQATRDRKGPGQFSRADRNRHRRINHNLRRALQAFQSLAREHSRSPSRALLLDSSCYG